MQILAAHYLSGRTFLNDYAQDPPPARLFYRTKVALSERDDLLLEIRFPELPSRVLVHASVAGREDDKGGVWLTFAEEDHPTRDFIVSVARGDGDVQGAAARKSPRFPVELPANVTAAGGDAPVPSETGDLSAGGAFVKTDRPPPVGTPVALVIAPPGHDSVTLPGVVAWVRRGESADGMGIRFDHPDPEEGRRLRELLRRIKETGAVK